MTLNHEFCFIRSQLNLVLAGTSSGLTTMLEGDAKCLDHRTFLEAIKIGLEQCAKIASSIEAMGEEMGKPKRQFEPGSQVFFFLGIFMILF